MSSYLSHFFAGLNQTILQNLQVEFPSRYIHLLSLVEPFVFAKLSVKSPLLKPPHFEREAGSQLLQPGLRLGLVRLLVHLLPFLKHIPMMTNKYVVALVVESSHLPAAKLSVVREQTPKETTSAVTQPGRETVEYELRNVGRGGSSHGNVLGQHYVGNLEEGCRTSFPLRRIDGTSPQIRTRLRAGGEILSFRCTSSISR